MRCVLGVLVLALGACTSTPPHAPAEYLLRPPLEDSPRRLEQPPYAALGRISLPPYLERRGIVLEMGDQRLNVARDHRWAEPLSRSVRRMLQVGISRATGRTVVDDARDSSAHEVVIDVNIHRLHGSVEGEVMLAADWQIREAASGRILEGNELVRTALTDKSGYGALVHEHATLLEELSQAIAQSLESISTGSQ